MIINESNKKNILQGKMKRGFNQTPQDIKDKLYLQKSNEKTNDNANSNNKESLSLKNAFNNLKRINK